jgi:hypothetical protein
MSFSGEQTRKMLYPNEFGHPPAEIAFMLKVAFCGGIRA